MSSDESPKRSSIDDLARELESAHLRIRNLEKALVEREQQEEQRQEKFRTAIENDAFLVQSAEMAQLGYAVWDDILDKDVSVSEELARIHGLTSEEYRKSVVSMEKYLEFVVPEDHEKYMAYENQFSADLSNKIANVEYCIKRPDGEIRYLHQRSQYVSASSGKPTQSIVVIQDITDQKQVELRL